MRHLSSSWTAILIRLGIRGRKKRQRVPRRRPRFEPLEQRAMLAVIGDFNMTGVVDENDYVFWKSEFGNAGSGLTADGNGDGTVDAADYTVWRDNLGAEALPGAIEDHVTLVDGILTICGTILDDVITVTEDAVTIEGIGTLAIDVALASEIRIHPFAGDDEVSMDSAITAPASIFGLAGDDLLSGASGDDTIEGGEGNDTIAGGGGDDHLNGGLGDDEFVIAQAESYLNDTYFDPDQVPQVSDGLGNTNHPPQIQAVANRTINAGSPLEFQVRANDIDEPSTGLHFAFAGPNHGATLSSTGLFSWTPSWELAEETDYTFQVRVTDNGSPVLQHIQEFKVRVVPTSPTKLRLTAAWNDRDVKQVEWSPLSGAIGYILERQAWDGVWTQAADTTDPHYQDVAYPAGAFSYRVKAYNSNGEHTPFSAPITDYFLELPSTDGGPFLSFNGTSVLVTWSPFDPGEFYLDVPVIEYVVERIHSSEEGWVEVHRTPANSSSYSFTDSSIVPGEGYEYRVFAVTETFNGVPEHSFSGPVPPNAGWGVADLGFQFGDHNPPHLLDIPDSAEESVGYYIPVNNNFDENNIDASGNPVRDNEPNASTGHRAKFDIYRDLSDRQLTSFSVLREGIARSFDQIIFEYPAAIKIWTDFFSDPYELVEVASGVPYNFDDFSDFGLSMFMEGIDESSSLRDIELMVTLSSNDAPGVLFEDKIRFTVGNLSAEVAGEIDADTAEISAYVPIAPFTNEYDGETVTLNLRRDGTVVETLETVIEDGQVVAIFSTGHVAGAEYEVETVFRGMRGMSDAVELIAGAPHTIETVASKTKYTADGTDTTTITVTVRDQFGNLVEDGTPVSWSMPFGDGVFTNGDALAATETTDGQVTITLRAPDVPGLQRVVATAGTAETSLDIVAEAADFQINGVADLDIAVGESGVVTIANANVANGTPVFWTLSNGQIVGGEDGGRVLEGTVQNGTASINIAATGPWARVGVGAVTATIAGRLYHHEVDFHTTGPFAVEIDQFVLAGDKSSNGVETIIYEDSNPTWEGQPAWGFGPPPQNWPAPKNVDYFAETNVIIRGTAFETYYLIADSAFNAFAQFQGLGGSNDIQLNAVGVATFTIRSKGLLAENEFLPIEFTVREGSPFVGAPETTERAMLVDHDWLTRTVDFGNGFIGGDPQGVSGIGGGIAGGLLLIGDVGSLAKNGWRAAGQSDKPVNKTEVALAGVGVVTTLLVVTGPVDAPIAAIRSLIAATDGFQLAKVLSGYLARGFTSTADLVKLGEFALKIMKSDVALQGAKQVFTSEALVEAAVRTVDKLGDVSEKFIERVARISASAGIKTAQDVTTLFGKLSDATLDVFRNLNPDQLDVAVDQLGTIFRAGKVDVAQLRKLLDNPQLFTTAYDRAMVIRDLSILSNAEGIGNLTKQLGGAVLEGPIVGRLYELQSAARIADVNPAANVTFVSKYTKEVDTVTGKILASTDIDFIVDDGVNVIYYQAKTSASAFGASAAAARTGAERWVRLAQHDAANSGISNQAIKYVVPSQDLIPQSVADFFDEIAPELVIEIVESPLLR